MSKQKALLPPEGIAPLDPTLGPAMQLLGEDSQRFVSEYLLVGGSIDRVSDAVWEAGMVSDPLKAKAFAMGLLRQPKILAAIKEEADKRMRAAAILGASVLVEIANDKLHKDRLKASVELLNRAGLIVEDVSRVIVEDKRSTDEIVKSVVALAGKVGVDPRKLLGNVIDAEYTEVEDNSFEAIMERSA